MEGSQEGKARTGLGRRDGRRRGRKAGIDLQQKFDKSYTKQVIQPSTVVFADVFASSLPADRHRSLQLARTHWTKLNFCLVNTFDHFLVRHVIGVRNFH